MKKIISLIIVLCLCFALMGCGGGSDSDSSSEGDPNVTAYYENGNLYIPLITYPARRPRLQKSYTIKSDKCIWYIKTFTGVNTAVPSGKTKITLPNKNSVVIVPEKYANDYYHIITRCSYRRGNKNISYDYHILIRDR